MKNASFLTETPIAHRGLHGEGVPENSMAAFFAAAERGYAIETDVRFSADGVLVVFHDDSLRRMTGIDRPVSACTARELTQIRLSESEERIPLFSDFVARIAGRAPVLLEIKDMPNVDGARVAKAIFETIGNAPFEYAVQSFQPAYVKAYKRLCPAVPCGILATGQPFTKADFHGSPFWRVKAHVLKYMSLNRSVKPDFISYRIQDLPFRRVSKFQGAKLGWTVRSEEDARHALQYVDNIIFERIRPPLSPADENPPPEPHANC